MKIKRVQCSSILFLVGGGISSLINTCHCDDEKERKWKKKLRNGISFLILNSEYRTRCCRCVVLRLHENKGKFENSFSWLIHALSVCKIFSFLLLHFNIIQMFGKTLYPNVTCVFLNFSIS